MVIIHDKIKKLRLKHGMTLQDLSDQTGLSVSFLSQIERGTSSLAITSLKKIADAFGIKISDFLNEIENHNYTVLKKEQKPFKIESSDITHVRLAGDFPNRKLEPMKVTIPPSQTYSQPYTHPGEEFYYVIKGTIVFKINEVKYQLNEGDSIHFPSNQPHVWKNPGKEPCILLSVLTPVIF